MQIPHTDQTVISSRDLWAHTSINFCNCLYKQQKRILPVRQSLATFLYEMKETLIVQKCSSHVHQFKNFLEKFVS